MGRLNRAPGRGRADGRDARCLRRCASFLAEFNALETDGVDAATLGDTRGVPKTCSKAGQRRSFHHLLKSALNSETQSIQVAKPQTAKKGTKIIEFDDPLANEFYVLVRGKVAGVAAPCRAVKLLYGHAPHGCHEVHLQSSVFYQIPLPLLIPCWVY